MWSTRKPIGKLSGILLLSLITSASLFGEESGKESKESKDKSNFILTIKDNLISLDAKDASLKEIVEEIASKMKIDIVAKIPGEKKVTIKFDKLSLKDAIDRLRKYGDVVYRKDPFKFELDPSEVEKEK